jgi:tetratricopeptide (TPR) repeat protein
MVGPTPPCERAPVNRETLEDLAGRALQERREEEVLIKLEAWLQSHPDDVRIGQWLALLLRALDRRDEAVAILRRCVGFAPRDAGLAFALAQVSLEAGFPARKLFDQALRLAPGRGDIRIGSIAARYAEGEGRQALADLASDLRASPLWLEGHRQYAQLAAMIGEPARAMESIEGSQVSHPREAGLHFLEIELLIAAEAYPAALAAIDRAARLIGELPALRAYRAAALDELGEPQARPAFAALGPSADAGHAAFLLRHLLRSGQIEQACGEIDRWLAQPGMNQLWPYAGLAWRIAGDPRADWLDADGAYVKTYEIAPGELDFAALADYLRRLHAGSGRFLDQSVRSGTQTDGSLLARCDPVVTQLRVALLSRINSYRSSLPAPDPNHPLLRENRSRPSRFAGSWSVRFSGQGHHAAHHHLQGWVSSAFYVAVPDNLVGGEGELVLGGAPEGLNIQLEPLRRLAPRPGRLVIFPSTMWHATRPFTAGERMSVAFDIARA